MRLRQRPIRLTEWESRELELDSRELANIVQVAGAAGITVEPTSSSGRFRITASSTVGAVRAGTLDIVIEPKLEIHNVLHMAGSGRRFPALLERTNIAQTGGLTELLAAMFAGGLAQALTQGLVQDYRAVDEDLLGIRGRVRFADQLRSRRGLAIPVAVTYDDFTFDTDHNRRIKAALRRLQILPTLRSEVRALLAGLANRLEAVADVHVDPRKQSLVPHDRRYEAFREVSELSALVLSGKGVRLGLGQTTASGFLLDMNRLFEDFVFSEIGLGIREAAADARYSWKQNRPLALDEGGLVRLEPDLSLMHGASHVFVGDVKYKRTDRGTNADLYQAIAYCHATGLKSATLVYADAGGRKTEHRILHSGPRVEVLDVDVSQPPEVLSGSLRRFGADLPANP